MDVDMLERSLQRTGAVVSNIDAGRLGDPTGCPEWTVGNLLAHVITGFHSMAAGAESKVVEMSEDTSHLGDDHLAAYREAADAALRAFERPGAMDKTFTLPWGDTPASMALFLAVTDATVHGWDLAAATDQERDVDDDIAEAIHSMTTSMMEPLGSYPRKGAFARPFEVPDDAPIQERMLAYLGRRA